MNINFVLSNTILFILLMDPFGNLPLFVSILRDTSSRRFRQIVLRECLFALVLMILALFAGRRFMDILGLSPGILRLSGGLILLLMGIKMVFSTIVPDHSAAGMEANGKEPYIVPLAIPLICGPGTLALLMSFLDSSPEATVPNVLSAVILAWSGQGVILLFGKRIAQLMGNRLLDALESLMGLLLTTIAIGMLIAGIQEIYGIPASL